MSYPSDRQTDRYASFCKTTLTQGPLPRCRPCRNGHDRSSHCVANLVVLRGSAAESVHVEYELRALRVSRLGREHPASEGGVEQRPSTTESKFNTCAEMND